MLQTLTYRTRKCWGTMVKLTIWRRGHTAQSVAYLGHQRHNEAAKRLSQKRGKRGSRQGKGGSIRGHEFMLDLLFALVQGGSAEEADAVEEVGGVAAGREMATRSSAQGARTGWRTRADLPKSWILRKLCGATRGFWRFRREWSNPSPWRT